MIPQGPGHFQFEWHTRTSDVFHTAVPGFRSYRQPPSVASPIFVVEVVDRPTSQLRAIGDLYPAYIFTYLCKDGAERSIC